MKSLLLVGGGGHCRSCIDVIEAEGKCQIAGIVEKPGGARSQVMGYTVLGEDEDLPKLLECHPCALVTVGQIKSANQRVKLYAALKEMGARIPSVVSPRAYISKHAGVQEGVIVMHDAILNAGASVGANCIINTQALIEHDVVVGPHCHISTGVKVNGGVFIGAGSFVGSGAVIHHGVRIGEECIIAAGSVVHKNLQPKKIHLKTDII